MSRLVSLAAILALTVPLTLLAAPPAKPMPLDCAFRRMTTFGASISANTMIKTGINLAFQATGYDAFGVSPVDKIKNSRPGANTILDFSAMFGDPTGAEQIASMLARHRELAQSTAIIGIDAFYWDAAGNTCYNDTPQTEIPRLIDFARQNHIVLVLGSVPHEDPNKVWWNNNFKALRNYTWRQPVESCVNIINSILATECRSQDQCYIADLESVVRTINSGGSLTLKNGLSYDLYRVRPDGVHVSDFGSTFLMESILDAMESDPPSCARSP